VTLKIHSKWYAAFLLRVFAAQIFGHAELYQVLAFEIQEW